MVYLFKNKYLKFFETVNKRKNIYISSFLVLRYFQSLGQRTKDLFMRSLILFFVFDKISVHSNFVLPN